MGLVLSNDRIVDDNGDPIANAQMFVYEVGTTTDAPTYLDSDFTTPAPQPVLSNQFGIFPPVYIAQNYKQIFKDGDDNILPQFGGDDIEPASVGSATTADEGTVQFATTAEVAAKTAGKVIDSGDQGSMVFDGTQITTGTIALGRIPVSDILEVIYPVGAIYHSGKVSTNPSSTLGFGTWVAEAEGRVMVGVGTGNDTINSPRAFTVSETGGEYDHQLTASEMATVTYDADLHIDGDSSPISGGAEMGTSTVIDKLDIATNAGDQPHTNVQPYVAYYIWRRTA